MQPACSQLHDEERWPAAMPCLIITWPGQRVRGSSIQLALPTLRSSESCKCPSGRPICDVLPTMLMNLLLSHAPPFAVNFAEAICTAAG